MNEGKRKLTSTFLKGRLRHRRTSSLACSGHRGRKRPTLLVSPVVVAVTAYQMLFVTKDLYPHVFASTWIFFYGFVLAILAGVPFGFLMALNTSVRDYVNPWMATLYTTPRIAFAPVLLLWLGIGAGSKIAIVFLGCFFRF